MRADGITGNSTPFIGFESSSWLSVVRFDSALATAVEFVISGKTVEVDSPASFSSSPKLVATPFRLYEY